MRFEILLSLTLALSVSFSCGAESQENVPLISVAAFGTNGGASPVGNLVLGQDGAFYGVTEQGGASQGKEDRFGYGTVFRVTTNGKITTLFSFQGTNGANPMTGLTPGKDGKLYGVTYRGGKNSGGVAFCISTNGEAKVLHHFGDPDGWNGDLRVTQRLEHWHGGIKPMGGLILGEDGSFYGTTIEGGFNFGTVFKMSQAGQLTNLFDFQATNGNRASAELVQDTDGNLYGTAESGGPNSRSRGGYGTVFKLNSAGQLLWCFGFGGTNGLHPNAGLVLGPDGNFYGSTYGGWYDALDKNQMMQNDGTIFRLTTNGVLTTLVSFHNTNGACPIGRLVWAGDGNFYGVVRFYHGVGMASDSPMGNGAIFQMSLDVKFRIEAVIGDGDFNIHPAGGLTKGPDGDLYGLTRGPGTNQVFKMRVLARHFGDPAPLRVALSKLKLAHLSEARFSPVPMFGENSVTAYFNDPDGTKLEITAAAYDSHEAAKASWEKDQWKSAVNWKEKQIVAGVDVYAYENYGRVDFQAGPYTFTVITIRHGNENLQPLSRKVSSALIDEFGH